MPDQLQLRGGTTSEHNSFTGVTREVTVDTTKKTLVVHDGSTQGGIPLMKEGGSNNAAAVGIGTGGTNRLNISSTEVVFNDNSSDTDFRIEGNGNANLFVVDAGNDKIGIGTSAPQHTLTVRGGTDTLAIQSDHNAASGQDKGGILGLGGKFNNNGGINDYSNYGEIRGLKDNNSNNQDGGYLSFYTKTNGVAIAERMRINTSGNVGIGTTSPTYKLEISGQTAISGDARFLTGSRHKFIGGGSGNNLELGTYSSSNTSRDVHMIIDSSGQVGIGAASPNSLLNVHGVIETNAFDTANGQGGRNSTGLLIGDAYTAGKTSSDDRNSIIWNERGLDLDIATSDTLRIKVKHDGKVGINKADPDAQFVVYRPTVNGANPILQARSNHDTTDSVKFEIDGDGDAYFSDLIGIGTTSPAGYNANANDIVINKSGNSGITISTPNSNTGRIAFGDPEDNNVGQIRYQHSDNKMIFDVSASERMLINATGQLAIGRSDPRDWHSSYRSIQLVDAGQIYANANDSFMAIGANHYLNSGGNFIYDKADFASRFYQLDGAFHFENAASGSAGASLSFASKMVLSQAGNLGIGTASPSTPLHALRITDNARTATISNGGTTGGHCLKVTSGGTGAGSHIFNCFRNNQSSEQEVFRVDGNGNVGIGATTIADDTDHAKLALSGQSGTAAGIITFQDTSNNEDGMIFADNGHLYLVADRANATADSSIRFRVDGSSERARIDHVGRLLVGVTAPILNENGFNEIVVGGKSEGAGIHLKDDNGNVQAGMFTSDSSNKLVVRTITNHPIEFRTNNTNRINLDENGNFTFSMSANSNYPVQKLKWSNDSTTTNGFYIAQHSDRNARIWHEQGLDIVFGTNNTEQMRLDLNGNLAIGTSTAINNSGYGGLTLDGTSGGIVSFKRNDVERGRIGLVGENNLVIQSPPGASSFITFNKLTHDGNNAVNGATELARFDVTGHFLVGTTSNNIGINAATEGVAIREEGHVVSRGTSSNAAMFTAKTTDTGGSKAFRVMLAQREIGSISMGAGGTAFNTSSDYRRKENVVTLTDAITRLKTLTPKRFNFKTEPSVTRDGFLAHEVTAVPEAVTGTKDAVATESDVTRGVSEKVGDPIYQQLDQSKLVPLLTAALQEAITKIETLEAKVAALEAA